MGLTAILRISNRPLEIIWETRKRLKCTSRDGEREWEIGGTGKEREERGGGGSLAPLG